jgi:hypothetical protein
MVVRKLVRDSSSLRDKIISFFKKFEIKNPSHAEGFFLCTASISLKITLGDSALRSYLTPSS